MLLLQAMQAAGQSSFAEDTSYESAPGISDTLDEEQEPGLLSNVGRGAALPGKTRYPDRLAG